MEISYQRKHNDSFMILEGQLDKNSYEVRMIQDNNIFSLLDITAFSIDGKNQLSYKISRKENLEDFVESHDLTLELMQRLIINLKLALNEISKYLIEENHIWLSKESIFVEKTGESLKLSLCFYPEDFGTIQEQFRTLMDFFLSALSREDNEAAGRIYMAYDLCLKDDFTLDEIIDYLTAEEQDEIHVEQVSIYDDESEVYSEKVAEPEYVSDYLDYEEEKRGLVDHILYSIKCMFRKRSVLEEKVENFEDFLVDPEIDFDEPTVLLADAKPIGKLVYDGNNNGDDFLINKDIFRIGSANNNDAVIHSKTVSGNHAKIIREDGVFFLTDSNSLNGSYVNSTQLAYRQRYKLKPMDIIRFASESYVFM